MALSFPVGGPLAFSELSQPKEPFAVLCVGG